MLRILNLARRLWLGYQIWAVRVTIAGQGEVLLCVAEPMLAGRIEIARHTARAELARLLARRDDLRKGRP